MSKSSAHAKASGAASPMRSGVSLLQRQTAPAHVCVQRHANTSTIQPNAPSLVREALEAPGQPLDGATREGMEAHLGHDFSQVRVHTDERAVDSAAAVGANAYTAGTDILFAAGQYSPGTAGGQQLIAHELTHVLQQSAGPVTGTPIGGGVQVSQPGDSFESQARAAAAGTAPPVATGTAGPMPVHAPSPAHATSPALFLQRDTAGDVGAVAGVAGAALGLGALIVGLLQLKAAHETPAQPTGGLALTNVQFSANAAQPTAQAGGAPTPGASDAAPPAPQSLSKAVLSVSASEDSTATVDLTTRTDGHSIIEGYTQEHDVRGYGGGSTGDNANVTFRASQVPGTDPAIAEESILMEGINTSGSRLQRFAGRFRARGNGDVVCDAVHKTMGPGTVERSDSPPYAVVRLQDPVASNASSAIGGPSERGSGIRFDVPNPPILDRP